MLDNLSMTITLIVGAGVILSWFAGAVGMKYALNGMRADVKDIKITVADNNKILSRQLDDIKDDIHNIDKRLVVVEVKEDL